MVTPRTGNPNGRPTVYHKGLPQQMIEFFNKPLYTEVIKQVASAGKVVNVTEIKPTAFPTFDKFSREIGVVHHTLIAWCKDHPEFSTAYTICKGLQKDFLVEHGLNNNYNAGFAKFVAINCTDLKETIVHEVSDDAKKLIINISKAESGL